MNDNEMKDFVKFEKSLPKRFKKLQKEIDEHIESCWRCRNSFWYHKEIRDKMIECNEILKKRGFQ